MNANTKILLVALAAGTLGALASLWMTAPGPLLRSGLGQRVVGDVLALSAPAPPRGVSVAKHGGQIPSMTLPDLAGGPITLPAAYAGRPILINLWASWCGPCLKEMPELERFSAAQGGNGVQVVGIALDDDAAVRAFLARRPVSYPILIDAPSRTDAGVRLGNPNGVLPYSALISTDGRLVKQRIGAFDQGEITRWVGD